MRLSSRLIYSLGGLFSIGLVAFSFYLEIYQQLQPCSLCLIQRWLVVSLGLLCGIGFFLCSTPRYFQKIYAGTFTLIALLGTVTAARKIWLEHLPHDQLPPCAPGLQFMLEHFPLHEILQALFQGSKDCGIVEWQFLGIALSEWTFMAFLVFVGLGLLQLFRRNT